MRGLGARARALAVAIAVLSVGGAVGGAASPARAAQPALTVCMGHETLSGEVPGDVYLPAGITCYVTEAHVRGRISIGPNAQLYMQSSHVDSGLTVGTLAGATSTGSYIGGTVHLDYAGSLDLYSNSTLVGDVQGVLTGPTFEFENAAGFNISHSVVHGDISVRIEAHYPGAVLWGATIDGDVRVNTANVDFSDSHITGRVSLGDARTNIYPAEGYGRPSYLCAVTVDGNLTLHDSPGAVLLGGGLVCPGVQPITVRGSVLILDNTGSVHISAHIGGDVVCRRNTHHPVAGHPTSKHLRTTVGGHALGQCTTLIHD